MKIVFILLLSVPVFGQLPQRDLDATVSFYRAVDLQKVMPPPVINEDFKKSIIAALPTEFKRIPSLDAPAKKVLAPLLSFYNRHYDIIVIASETPFMMSDTSVLIVLSTGVLKRAQSDDELFGLAAHEIAHEYLAKYSLYCRYMLESPVMQLRAAEMLSLVELQCDAFAARTLATLGYDALAFIESMERILKDYPNHPLDHHPPLNQRKEVVSKLSPRVTRRQSEEFITLKKALVIP